MKESEYEVEEILDSKLIRRKLCYLIKWKGYSMSENTWESASNVQNSLALVDEFHAQYPDEPRHLENSQRHVKFTSNPRSMPARAVTAKQ